MFITNNFGGRLQKIDLTMEDTELLVHVTRDLRIYIDNLEHIRSANAIVIVPFVFFLLSVILLLELSFKDSSNLDEKIDDALKSDCISERH